MLIEGVIASAPDADRRVTVTIPTFHPEQTFGPCPYMPRGGALPAVGARCLVALDETGIQEPWVPAWDGPDGGAVANGAWVDVGSSGVPSFGSGYSSLSTAHKPQVMKDANGFVHGRGLAKGSGGATATLLDLPAGWRPGSIPTIQATGALRGGAETTEALDTDATSNIVLLRKGALTASGDWVSLGGLLFLAEA